MNTGPVEKCSDTNGLSSNYVDSNVQYTIDTQQSTKLSPITSQKPVRHKPWTPEWLNQILRNSELTMAVGHLRAWMPDRREKEALETTVKAIRQLSPEKAIEAIKTLKQNKNSSKELKVMI